MRTSKAIMLVLLDLSAACHCAKADDMETDGDTTLASSSSDTSAEGSSTNDGSSTGEPFDASRWVGVYHFENPFLPFGELVDPLPVATDRALANFEIFADFHATMLYDDCSFEETIVIDYTWESDEADWLRLRPGAGETSLRYMAIENLESLRLRRSEPADSCRPQLNFEYDGQLDAWSSFFPGESCWVDRCTVPNRFQVDYCEGEEPPSCP